MVLLTHNLDLDCGQHLFRLGSFTRALEPAPRRTAGAGVATSPGVGLGVRTSEKSYLRVFPLLLSPARGAAAAPGTVVWAKARGNDFHSPELS